MDTADRCDCCGRDSAKAGDGKVRPIYTDPFTGESTFANGRYLNLCGMCSRYAKLAGKKHRSEIRRATQKARQASCEFWESRQQEPAPPEE